MEKNNKKLFEEFGDWHFHKFWKKFLSLNNVVKEENTTLIPRDYKNFSDTTLELILKTKPICEIARRLRGEIMPLDINFYTKKVEEEFKELKFEQKKTPNININNFSVEKAIINTNNKILKRCLENFEGNFFPKRKFKNRK